MSNPIISVVVPIYNMENYLSRCLETLLNQTYDNYEIILVDDGSSDNSAVLCKEYCMKYPSKMRYIYKENGGLSSARNAGIQEAMGKYIIFPDPDDWVESNYLMELIKIQEDTEADLVCTGHYIDYDDRKEFGSQETEKRLLKGMDAKKALIIPPCINGFAWNKLYHLNIIRRNDLRFLDDVGTTEDLDFAYRYIEFCNTIIFAPAIHTYHYYQRQGAATHSGYSVKQLEAIRTYEKIVDKEGEYSELGRAAKGEICNTAINLIPGYFEGSTKRKADYKRIRYYIKDNFRIYLESSKYNNGRKIQAIFARISPRLYWIIKRLITK